MLLTEEEARTKWCHCLRQEGSEDNRCMASGCMAWRWAKGEWHGKEPRGYCGLARDGK